MKQTKAPVTTPSPTGDERPDSAVGKTGNPSSVFIGMALDMSWRLAIVVLVPIIGGFELDQRFKLTPLLTITGFAVAMIGMALVLWQMMQTVNQVSAPNKEKHS